MTTRLTYLSMDPLAEGVGSSQVVPYLERLAALGADITVHSFEHGEPSAAITDRLRRAGVAWTPHPFGRLGPVGGLGRVLRAARHLRGADLVHARSDLSAAAALLARPRRWVWDVRSFWADQRIALGMLRRGSLEERVLRLVERRAAQRCDAIVTLAATAIPVLAERHGAHVAAKAHVVPTCVDLDRFPFAAPPRPGPVRLLLSGTINGYYDVPTMLRLVELARRRRPTELVVLAPSSTDWDADLERAGALRATATPWEVPPHMAESNVGLSVCRLDAGVSLLAAMPTKIAEFLATGRPVIVSAGLGDAERLVEEHRCGVVVRATDDASLEDALDELEALLADEDTPRRCRSLAEAHFDVANGARTLMRVYRATS